MHFLLLGFRVVTCQIFTQWVTIVLYSLTYIFIITTHTAHPTRITTSGVSQLDNYAVDNIIIRCVEDGPSDGAADNYSISSHHQIIGRRRCRFAVTSNCE